VRNLFLFFIIVAAVLLSGAVLAYPLHLLLGTIFELRFAKVVHFSMVLTALGLGIWYLTISRMGSTVLGLTPGYMETGRRLITGFAAGVLILMLVESCLFLAGMRQPDPDLQAGAVALVIAVLKALVSGLLVGLIEEATYRGAIFSGLARYTTTTAALILSSLLYAAVHFIHLPELPVGEDIFWNSGIILLSQSFTSFTDPSINDSFLTLLLLGLLLCRIRLHTGNIILCTGVHAGIVTMDKIMSYATDYRSGSPWDFLVNPADQPNGYLASFWLILCLMLYHFVTGRQR
jgi:hypothetical protein